MWLYGNKGGDGRVELKKRKEGFLSGPSGRIVFKSPGRAGRAQANEDGGQVLGCACTEIRCLNK